MKAIIKKEIKKQVHKVTGSNVYTVETALKLQFPSIIIEEWKTFIQNEFVKKYKL